MKICTKCKIEKSHGSFYKEKAKKDGLHSHCKLCSVIRLKEWSEKNPDKIAKIRRKYDSRHSQERIAFLADMKKKKGCIDCGYNLHHAALQFDHVMGDKLFNIGVKKAHVSMESLLSEVAKCEIRCANCHAVATYNRRLR